MTDLARRQHGVVTREQLYALGLTRHAVNGRVSRGLLQPVYPGVYAFGGARLTAMGRRMAAVLVCGPAAVLSHRPAARLWGIAPYEPARIEVSRDLQGRTKRDGILLHQARLLPDEVSEVDGIPATSISRTILDLAAVTSRREVERAFHETEVRGLTDRVSLPQLLARHPGRRGAATVRAILAGRTPSGITRTSRSCSSPFLTATDYPGRASTRRWRCGGRFFEPDCLWELERLIVELDGRAVHGAERAFESDRQRDRILLTEGWRSTRITWRQLRDEPDAIAADLRELLRGTDSPPTL